MLRILRAIQRIEIKIAAEISAASDASGAPAWDDQLEYKFHFGETACAKALL